jgi:two-component system C4-dicarboxylate transport sensor histidine kinase DctB
MVSLDIRENEVRLAIADNGPGIAAEVADRLFTPFTTSRESGLGLGLVIAQDIMTDLGGTLRLAPSENGACFEMILKRVP